MLLLIFLFVLIVERTLGIAVNATGNSATVISHPCTDKNNLVLAPGVFTSGGVNRACVSRFHPYGIARVQLALYVEDRLSTTSTRELPPGDGGCLDMTVPQLPNMKADLFVSIIYPEVQCVWERRLSIRISSGRVVIVQTERARYRPGDAVRVRIIALKSDLAPSHGFVQGLLGPADYILSSSLPPDISTLRTVVWYLPAAPDHGTITMIEEVWLEGPKGSWEGTRVSQWLQVRTRLGLAQLQYQLDPLAPPGRWTFRAKLEDGSQGSATFWVGNYELPPFQLSVRHSPKVLRTSERIMWTVCVRYPWSEAVEGMLVIRLHGAGRGGSGVRTAVQLRAPKACHRHAVAAKRVGLHSSKPPEVLVAEFSFQEDGTRIWQNTTVVSQVVENAINIEFLTKQHTVISPGLPYKLKVKVTRYDDKPIASKNVLVCRFPTHVPIGLSHVSSRDTKACTDGQTDGNGVAVLNFLPVSNEAPFYDFEAQLINDSSVTTTLRVRVRPGTLQATIGALKADSFSSRILVPLYFNTRITRPITVHFVLITRGGVIYRWGATTQSPISSAIDEKNVSPCDGKCSYYGYNSQKENLANHDDPSHKFCHHGGKHIKREINNTEMILSVLLGEHSNNGVPNAVPQNNPALEPWQETLYNQNQNNAFIADYTKAEQRNPVSNETLYNRPISREASISKEGNTILYTKSVPRDGLNIFGENFPRTTPMLPENDDATQVPKVVDKESTVFTLSDQIQPAIPTDPDYNSLEFSIRSDNTNSSSGSSVLTDKTKVLLPIKVSQQMCPDSHLIAYFYYKGELVSASKHFEMDECFANKAEATWLTRQAQPGSTVSLQVTTTGPALCALSVLDTATKWIQSPPSTKELLIKSLKRVIQSHRNLTEYEEGGECFLNSDTVEMPTSNLALTSLWLASAGIRLLGGEAPKHARHRQCYHVPPATLTSEEALPRTDFSEAWLWRLLPVSGNGTGIVTAIAPDSITRYEASATCLSKTGIAVSPPAVLQVFREFFIHADSPKRLRRGDTAIIRYRIFNYLYTPLSVEIITDPYMEVESVSEVVCIKERSVVARRAKVTPRGSGHLKLTLKARTVNDSTCPDATITEPVSDEIIIRIAVDPEGVPIHEQKSIMLCGNDTDQSVSAVEWAWSTVRVVPGTETLTLWAVGDVTGPLLSDADSLVLIPRGCGEQNMAQLATNLLALNILDKTSLAALTAREHVARGFTRQLQYLHPSGGFSAFGPSDAISSTWLTAFAVRHLRKAHQLLWPTVQVPFALIRAERWLINQQMENGCFRNEGQVFHRELRGGLDEDGEVASVALTAYVITSLIESTAALPYRVLRNSYSCLRALPPTKTNSPARVYAQALLAYAFMRIDKYEDELRNSNKVNLLKHMALEENEALRQVLKLLKMAKRSGNYLWWEASSLATSIEATSYALLALRWCPTPVRVLGGLNDAAAAQRWLAAHRSTTGGFVSTQDTLVALEALTAWSSDNPSVNLNVTAQCENTIQTVTLLPGIKIPEVMRLAPGEKVKVKVSGTGCALIQATRSYNTLAPPPNRDKLLSVQVNVHTDGPFDCDYNVTNTCYCAAVIEVCVMWNRGFPEMALLEVLLPGGYGADAQLLYSQLNQQGSLLRRIELSPTNSRCTLYLGTRGGAGGAASGHECYRVHAVGPRARTHAAFVRLHDYYQPLHNDTQVFTIPEECPPRIFHKIKAEYRPEDNLYENAVSHDDGEILITDEFSIEDMFNRSPIEDYLFDNLTRNVKTEEYSNVSLGNDIQDNPVKNIRNSNITFKEADYFEKDQQNLKTEMYLENDIQTTEIEENFNIQTPKYKTEQPNDNLFIIEKHMTNENFDPISLILPKPRISTTELPISNIQTEKYIENSKINDRKCDSPDEELVMDPPITVGVINKLVKNSEIDEDEYASQMVVSNTESSIRNFEIETPFQKSEIGIEKSIQHKPELIATPIAIDIEIDKNIQNGKIVKVFTGPPFTSEHFNNMAINLSSTTKLSRDSGIEKENYRLQQHRDIIVPTESDIDTDKYLQNNERKYILQRPNVRTETPNTKFAEQSNVPIEETDIINKYIPNNTGAVIEKPNANFGKENEKNSGNDLSKFTQRAVEVKTNTDPNLQDKSKNEFDVMDIINLYESTPENHYTTYPKGSDSLDVYPLNYMEDSHYPNGIANYFKHITESDSSNRNDFAISSHQRKEKENELLKPVYDSEETTTTENSPKIIPQVPVPVENKGVDNPNLSDFHVIDSEVDLDVPSGIEGPIPTVILPPPNFMPSNAKPRLRTFYTSHGPYYYFRPNGENKRMFFLPKSRS